MKTTALFIAAGLVLGGSFARGGAKLEVHEWGTFTVVAGSDGVAQRWYEPQRSVSELPKFVRSERAGGKGGGSMDFVRMETPVLYFYSDQPTPLTVKALFHEGRITERFPPNAPAPQKADDAQADEKKYDDALLRAVQQAMSEPGDMRSAFYRVLRTPFESPMSWKGELVAPDNLIAAGKIPSLSGQPGQHYGHAREVPGAWFFHATSVEPKSPDEVEQPNTDMWEKFIFYRGAGDALPTFSASAADEDSVKLTRTDVDDKPSVSFALNVEGKQARWVKLPGLIGTGYIQPKFDERGAILQPYGYPNVTAKFSEPLKPQEQIETELGAAMTSALTDAGLSLDEAKAMVATWRDVWFREPGTRVFALFPQAWVDGVLPVEISPKPQTFKRVFVGRFEIFTPAREKALLTLLDKETGTKPDDKTIAAFRAMNFGRFSFGAFQRAQELQTRRTEQRFYQIESAASAGT